MPFCLFYTIYGECEVTNKKCKIGYKEDFKNCKIFIEKSRAYFKR